MNNILKFAVVAVAIAAVGCAAFWYLSTEYDVTFTDEYELRGDYYEIDIKNMKTFSEKVSVMKNNAITFTVVVDSTKTSLSPTVVVNGTDLTPPVPVIVKNAAEVEIERLYTYSVKVDGNKEIKISFPPI